MDGITGLVITGMAPGMAPGMPGIFNARGDYDGGSGDAGVAVVLDEAALALLGARKAGEGNDRQALLRRSVWFLPAGSKRLVHTCS